MVIWCSLRLSIEICTLPVLNSAGAVNFAGKIVSCATAVTDDSTRASNMRNSFRFIAVLFYNSFLAIYNIDSLVWFFHFLTIEGIINVTTHVSLLHSAYAGGLLILADAVEP